MEKVGYCFWLGSMVALAASWPTVIWLFAIGKGGIEPVWYVPASFLTALIGVSYGVSALIALITPDSAKNNQRQNAGAPAVGEGDQDRRTKTQVSGEHVSWQTNFSQYRKLYTESQTALRYILRKLEVLMSSRQDGRKLRADDDARK